MILLFRLFVENLTSAFLQCSDPILKQMCPSYPVPASALHSLLVNAETAMQREIKGFISACIAESDKPKDKRNSRRHHMSRILYYFTALDGVGNHVVGFKVT